MHDSRARAASCSWPSFNKCAFVYCIYFSSFCFLLYKICLTNDCRSHNKNKIQAIRFDKWMLIAMDQPSRRCHFLLLFSIHYSTNSMTNHLLSFLLLLSVCSANDLRPTNWQFAMCVMCVVVRRASDHHRQLDFWNWHIVRANKLCVYGNSKSKEWAMRSNRTN